MDRYIIQKAGGWDRGREERESGETEERGREDNNKNVWIPFELARRCDSKVWWNVYSGAGVLGAWVVPGWCQVRKVGKCQGKMVP